MNSKYRTIASSGGCKVSTPNWIEAPLLKHMFVMCSVSFQT